MILAAIAALCLASLALADTTYHVDVGGPLDELFIRDGWYGPEGPYEQFGPIWRARCRWARQGATGRLPVFPGVVNTIEMRADIGQAEEQRLRCHVNGSPVGELPPNRELHYRFEVEADVLGDKGWAELRLETALRTAGGAQDPRDLRVAVDWIKVSADAPGRDFVREALEHEGVSLRGVVYDEVPKQWRFRYDPNSLGDTFAPQKLHEMTYDDSAFEVVGTDYVPAMRRGDAAWYRVSLVLSEKTEEVRAGFRLPGEGFEDDGRREVWINGAKVAVGEGLGVALAVVEAVAAGPNLVAVKIMQGPLPRATGDAIIERPAYSGRWTPERVSMVAGPLVLTPEFASAKELTVRLVAPSGEMGRPVQRELTDLPEGRRGTAESVVFGLEEFGEHRLVIQDDQGHYQELPVHSLGVHFFHWGWYSAAGGTTWTGFKPCSNDHLDELFGRLGDWDRPHHSICWGGAILAPGTGFHRTERVDYVAQFREAIAAGELGFVGMPYPPRNICTDFGESLLRSMRRSITLYESQLGVRPARFYSHDATMTPLLPQIMRLCGYDTYCIAENWWGQGRSIPNSRDCYFRDASGAEVRVLDSWYHGISPVRAARRAVEQGKPAVLCNEEFACLDRTLFLNQEDLDTLAAEGIFLQPIDLDTYQQVTEQFARRYTYEGDDALCYKGWTGGGEGEVEFEKANRLLETRLVALENTAALARWLGLEAEQAPIDEWWDRSLRWHECHTHWGNGSRERTNTMLEGVAWADEEMGRIVRLVATCVETKADSVVVFNPLGFERQGLVRTVVPEGAVALRQGRKVFPLQPDPDNLEVMLASFPDLPSCGYRSYEILTDARPATDVTAVVGNGTATLTSDVLRVTVGGAGEIVSVADGRKGEELVTGGNRLHLARAGGKRPDQPISTESDPLNLNHYLAPVGAGAPKVVCQGPVMAAVECDLRFPDYPSATGTLRLSLVAGERQVRARLSLSFPEPAAVFPPGTRGPHEGTYIPGIFVAFPFPKNAEPMADMAYCTTDGVLTSTNHETFMGLPFRNGTFNALSLAGPNTGEYAVLTRGLPDFFVVRPPDRPRDALLGLSLGLGAEDCPFKGEYIHEYALFVPPPRDRSKIGCQAFLAARSFLVEPLAQAIAPGDGELPAEWSFARATGEPVFIPGLEMGEDELRIRVVNLADRPVNTRVYSLLTGETSAARLKLPPKGLSELRGALTGEGPRRPTAGLERT